MLKYTIDHPCKVSAFLLNHKRWIINAPRTYKNVIDALQEGITDFKLPAPPSGGYKQPEVLVIFLIESAAADSDNTIIYEEVRSISTINEEEKEGGKRENA